MTRTPTGRPPLYSVGTWFALAVAAIVLIPIAANTSEASSELFAELPAIINEAGIPGLTIAVIEPGEAVAVRAFGHRDSAGQYPVEPETIFEAASLTKPVFTYGLLRLVERGDLDLDAPLTSYVDFPDIENDERVHKITARIVLTHTSGFPNWRGENPLTIGTDPGTEFRYSGEAFVFLARAVGEITGQPLDAFLGAEVLDPLGMTSSYLVWDDSLAQRTATGHDFVGSERPKWKPDEAGPAGTLHTTAGDYARFLAEILNPTLVDRALVEEMLRPQSAVADGVFWGLGWGLEEWSASGTATEFLLWHDGDNGWFKCYAMASPSRGLGLVFFTNSQNGHSVTEHIVGRVFGGTHPALAWNQYAAFDSPVFRIQRALALAGLVSGAEGIRREHATLLATYAPEDFEEAMMNRLGYRLMGMNATAAAVEVFRLNAETYPESWNTYDSLGEGLAALGDTSAAVQNYEKSLELHPDNTNATEVLEKLRTESHN